MVTKIDDSVSHLIPTCLTSKYIRYHLHSKICAQQHSISYLATSHQNFFVLRVSPPPPPEAFIAAWCACFHESLVITSSLGSNSAVNCSSRQSKRTSASAKHDTKAQTLSRIEASTGPAWLDAVDIALNVADLVLWRRTASIGPA